MLVTIAFGPDYESNAHELGSAVKSRWSTADVSYVGLSSPEYSEKYQVQLEQDIVYSKRTGESVESVNSIVTKIENRL
jgi:hypothetical protein